jgi:hypothetical protein
MSRRLQNVRVHEKRITQHSLTARLACSAPAVTRTLSLTERRWCSVARPRRLKRRRTVTGPAARAVAFPRATRLRPADAVAVTPTTLSLELAAVAAVGLAVGARRPAYGPAAVVAACIAAAVLWPARVLPPAGDHGQTRLVAAAIALAALAAYAHASRDPVRR